MFYELSGSEIANFSVPDAAGTGDFPDELTRLIPDVGGYGLADVA